MKEFNEEHIDDYLLGQLSGEALKAFQDKINEDKAFAEAVNARAELINFLEYAGDQEMREKLKHIHQKAITDQQPPSRKIRAVYYWVGIAASVMLLLCASYYLYTTNIKEESPQELLQAYYSTPVIAAAERGDTADLRWLASANQFYNKKDFEETLALIEDNTDESIPPKAILMAGVSHMELKQYPEALTDFGTLIAAQDVLLEEQARWLAALCYIQTGNKKQAINYLSILAEDANAYKNEEAQSLLEKIK